jgi:hypothetical protein
MRGATKSIGRLVVPYYQFPSKISKLPGTSDREAPNPPAQSSRQSVVLKWLAPRESFDSLVVTQWEPRLNEMKY